MPTNLDRIQTLLQPEAYAKVRTLAKANRRALSAMSAELVEEALKLPKYRQQIEDAEIQVPTRDDPRTDPKQRGLVKTMRESHYEPRSRSGELPTVWSVEADKARHEATEGMEEELVDDGDGGLYDANFYQGMTIKQIKAWDVASIAHLEETQAVPKMSTAQLTKLHVMVKAGEITPQQYNYLAGSQRLEEGEDKLVKEVEMKDQLLKTIGEQDERLQKMEEMMTQMAAMMAAKG